MAGGPGGSEPPLTSMMVQVRPYSIPAGGQSGCRSAGPSPRLRRAPLAAAMSYIGSTSTYQQRSASTSADPGSVNLKADERQRVCLLVGEVAGQPGQQLAEPPGVGINGERVVDHGL